MPDEMKMYYQNLYRKTTTNDSIRYLSDVENINKVTDEDYISMNKEITEAELLRIVKSLPNNKTPGEDGLPSEFYKMFWQDIKLCLLESYKHSYQTGNLSITQKRGILCLIPKNTDPLKLKNWRPLSLSNQDYKILSKLVADRMKIALPKIMNFDQSGFLKGRYIGQNITTIIDLMHFTTEENISALIIAVDFEKAFDTLEWTFMYQCLEKFNFPPTHKTMGQNTIYWYKKLRNQQWLELWILLPGKRGASGMPTLPIHVYPLRRNISPTSTK